MSLQPASLWRLLAQLVVLVIGLAYAYAPTFIEGAVPFEIVIAHLAGPLIAVAAISSCFPSLSFTRFFNNWIGFALAISPLVEFALRRGSPTALIVQSVVGLWVMGFSILAKPIHETGGWRRAIKHIDEVDLDWA